MPKAPCNPFCEGECSPAKGCAFNLLCICCPDPMFDPCIENNGDPAAATAEAQLEDDGAKSKQRAGDMLINFLLHSPHASGARVELRAAIKEAQAAGDLPTGGEQQ